MTKKKVWRFYCDHCRKGGYSGGHIRKHEKQCIRNPERECGMCESGCESPEPMPKLIAAYGDGMDLDALRELAVGCPACMLAAITQWRDQHKHLDDSETWDEKFDYKKEREEYWAVVNDANSLGVVL